MRILRPFVLIFFVIFFSCREDKRVVTIEGSLFDPNLNMELSEVEINLYTQDTESGAFSFVFDFQESILSDENGLFKFSIPFNYTLAYKLEFEKLNYFNYSVEIQSEELNSDDYLYRDFELFPEAELSMHFINSYSYDENDKILYRIIDWDQNCDGCCPPGFQELIGEDVDETIICKVIGEAEYTVEYIIFKNDNSNVSYRIVYCEAFEVSEVEVSY